MKEVNRTKPLRTAKFVRFLTVGFAVIGVSVSQTLANTASEPRSSISNFQLTEHNCRLAADYSAVNKGVSMLVMVDGKIIFEDYPNGSDPSKAFELASGTKSFSGIAAIAAQEDRLLNLDEKVADTIEEWRSDPVRSKITIRQLLNLVSGVKGTVGRCPPYQQGLNAPITAEPGKLFQYGAEPFQIFGELMRRKLKPTNENMVDYLKRRILDPIGVKVDTWRTGSDGMPLIPQGARLNARNWAKFGEFIRNQGTFQGKQILAPQNMKVITEGTDANPMYGLTWWLAKPIDKELRASIKTLTMASDIEYGAQGVPPDLFMAAGAGKQRLYISPSLKLVVVRQATGIMEALMTADQTGYSDNEFLCRLTTGKASPKGKTTASQSGLIGGASRGMLPSSFEGGDMSRKREKVMGIFDRNGDGKLDDNERQMLRQFFMKRRGQ